MLQGHICIDRMVFPENTTGYRLDSFARQFLWRDGLDYRHGTGHGVGHFLNVHEGPQGIGTRKSCDEVRLEAGMTLSNGEFPFLSDSSNWMKKFDGVDYENPSTIWQSLDSIKMTNSEFELSLWS